MKAVVFDELGAESRIEYREVPTPAPGPGEALIAVHAVSVNRGPDIATRGETFLQGILEFPHISGGDPAGEIVELGEGCEGLEIGERVAIYPMIACGSCQPCRDDLGENECLDWRVYGMHIQGGRAEYTVAPVSQLVRLPDEVSYADAAALGIAYTTTYHGIVTRGKLTADDTLLVMGAGGNVGIAAVQIAKLIGARTIAITGPDWKRERLEQLGADVVISYRDDDWTDQVMAATEGRGVSIAFDNAGTETLGSTLNCLAPRGRLVCSGVTSGDEVLINARRLYRNKITLYFYGNGRKTDIEELVALVAEGKLRPVIDSEFPLEDVFEAEERLLSGKHFGRVVLRVAPETARVAAPALS